MKADPLAPPPPRSPITEAFLRRTGLKRPKEPTADFLERLARAFARLPYENLTKILKLTSEGNPERARRDPPEVLADHFRYGAGGTCFSLTALLLHLVRSCGYEAHPVLADRHYGPDTHCALIVNLEDKPHLLDPGYLLFKPVPVRTDTVTEVDTDFNRVLLLPEGSDRLTLATKQNSVETKRLTFKLPGADPETFMRAWHASFFWDMMRYPILTCLRDGKQIYLRKIYYQERDKGGVRRVNLTGEKLLEEIATRFGIDPSLAAKALTVIVRKEKIDE